MSERECEIEKTQEKKKKYSCREIESESGKKEVYT